MSVSSLLHYQDIGQGYPLVLLHGFCESIHIWDDFAKKLSADFRVISIDLPGFGKSSFDAGEASIEFYADRVQQTLAALHVNKFVLAGHSLGGYVALALEEKYPQMPEGLILFHSSAFSDTEEKKADRNKTIGFVEKSGSEAFAGVLIPTLFTPHNLTAFKQDVSQATTIAANTNPHAIVHALKAMRDRKDRTFVISQTKKPVLFIIGKEDKAVPLEVSLKQCHLPAESLAYFLSDTAHMGMFEKSEETLAIIEDFLDICQRK